MSAAHGRLPPVHHRYRGRYIVTAIMFVFELPVFVALAVPALVTRALLGIVRLGRRLTGPDSP